MMMRLATLTTCALVACKSDPSREPAASSPNAEALVAAIKSSAIDAAPIDAAPIASGVSAPPASRLAICGTPTTREPLAAVCALGEPAAKATYDCAEPEPIMFCRGAIQWTCFRNVPGGEAVPPVRFSAYLASSAPVPKTGQFISTASMKREGTILGVELDWKESNDSRGAERVRALVDILVGWGCIVTDVRSMGYSRFDRSYLDCASWTAEVSYDGTKGMERILFKAQQRDSFTCQ